MAAPTLTFAGPSILVLTFRDGVLDGAGFEQYAPRPSDRSWGPLVWRDDDPYGRFAGEGQRDLWRFDDLSPTPLADFVEVRNQANGRRFADADKNGAYTVRDGAGREIAVTDVLRKSTVVESGKISNRETVAVREHAVTLKLARPVAEGDRVTVAFDDDDAQPISATFRDWRVSDAVRVSQIGFETDDPIKTAYVTLWHGRDNRDSRPGAERFDALDGLDGRDFKVVNVVTGRVEARGALTLAEPHDKHDDLNGAPVFRADFSELDRAGRYRVEIDGLGASEEFRVAHDVWTDAFVTSARGFYHQRSGIALTAEHTEWTRPRALHPEDGVTVAYQTTATLMDTHMGLNLKDRNSFDAVVAGATNRVVDDAFGGWHDAGDFDRRAQHLEAARTLMRLVELRPDFAEGAELDIPESGDGVPDLLDEALWGIDLFRRLQRGDGAVSGGIETDGHPTAGESSWTDAKPLYVYAPDPWASFEYAAAAAQAAHLLAEYAPERAGGYLNSARRAFDWAVANTPAYAERSVEVRDARTLAAAELYRAGGAAKHHDWFLDGSRYADGSLGQAKAQTDAGVTYAMTARASADASLQASIKEAITQQADRVLEDWGGAFDQYLDPQTAYAWRNTSGTPEAAAAFLIPAHAFSGDPRYFEAIVSDTFFGLGANPMSLSHTTGVGSTAPSEIWSRDSTILGGDPPPGITVFGGQEAGRVGQDVWRRRVEDWLDPMDFADLPPHENFQSHHWKLSEFTVDATMDATAFVWGYLAATDADVSGFFPDVAVTQARAEEERWFATPGADRFVFDRVSDSTRGKTDLIHNFQEGDVLDLSALPFDRIIAQGEPDDGELLVDVLGAGSVWEYVRIAAGWGWDDFQLRVEGDLETVRAALVLEGGAAPPPAPNPRPEPQPEPRPEPEPTPGPSPAPPPAGATVVELDWRARTYEPADGAQIYRAETIGDSVQNRMDVIRGFDAEEGDRIDLAAAGFSRDEIDVMALGVGKPWAFTRIEGPGDFTLRVDEPAWRVRDAILYDDDWG